MEDEKNGKSQITFHAPGSACKWIPEAVQLESLVTGGLFQYINKECIQDTVAQVWSEKNNEHTL